MKTFAPLDLAAPEADDPYVMYVIVCTPKDGNVLLDDVLVAYNEIMRNMLDDYALDGRWEDRFDAYFAGRIRKIVKRAKPNEWNKLLASSELEGNMLHSSVSTAHVAVTAPLQKTETPAVIRRLQVQGLHLVRSDKSTEIMESPAVMIHTDTNLGMSDGKLLAQVGHVIQVDWMTNGQKEPMIPAVQLIEEETLTLPDDDSTLVIIHDAGFTEIPSGSLTAYSVRA